MRLHPKPCAHRRLPRHQRLLWAHLVPVHLLPWTVWTSSQRIWKRWKSALPKFQLARCTSQMGQLGLAMLPACWVVDCSNRPSLLQSQISQQQLLQPEMPYELDWHGSMAGVLRWQVKQEFQHFQCCLDIGPHWVLSQKDWMWWMKSPVHTRPGRRFWNRGREGQAGPWWISLSERGCHVLYSLKSFERAKSTSMLLVWSLSLSCHLVQVEEDSISMRCLGLRLECCAEPHPAGVSLLLRTWTAEPTIGRLKKIWQIKAARLRVSIGLRCIANCVVLSSKNCPVCDGCNLLQTLYSNQTQVNKKAWYQQCLVAQIRTPWLSPCASWQRLPRASRALCRMRLHPKPCAHRRLPRHQRLLWAHLVPVHLLPWTVWTSSQRIWKRWKSALPKFQLARCTSQMGQLGLAMLPACWVVDCSNRPSLLQSQISQQQLLQPEMPYELDWHSRMIGLCLLLVLEACSDLLWDGNSVTGRRSYQSYLMTRFVPIQ